MSRTLWLPSVLRAAGCKVDTIAGWENRGRPGAFAPVGVLVHHTAGRPTMANPMPSLSTLVHGRPDLNGPLCQLGLGFDGRYRVIAAGRANHAGTARTSGPVPAGDGNALYLGIEVDYSGSQDMSELQYAALVRGCAALVKHMKRGPEFVRGHKETSSAGKWDPGRRGSSSPEYRMGEIRADVAAFLKPPPPPVTLWKVDWTDPEGVRQKGTATRDPAEFYARHKGAFQRASVIYRPLRDER